MKMRLLQLLAAGVLAFGCQGLYPRPEAPICDRTEAYGSVICRIAAEIGTSPEQMNDLLLDAALVPLAAKLTTAPRLREAVAKVQKYVVEREILTIKGCVGYLVSEAKLDPSLALLLSRRLVFLQVPELDIQALTAYDRELIEKHLANQAEQLRYF